MPHIFRDLMYPQGMTCTATDGTWCVSGSYSPYIAIGRIPDTEARTSRNLSINCKHHCDTTTSKIYLRKVTEMDWQGLKDTDIGIVVGWKGTLTYSNWCGGLQRQKFWTLPKLMWDRQGLGWWAIFQVPTQMSGDSWRTGMFCPTPNSAGNTTCSVKGI